MIASMLMWTGQIEDHGGHERSRDDDNLVTQVDKSGHGPPRVLHGSTKIPLADLDKVLSRSDVLLSNPLSQDGL